MRCDVCRFDSSTWGEQDRVRLLDAVATWWGHLCEGAPADVLGDLAPYRDRLAAVPLGSDDVEAVHAAWHDLAEAGRVRHRGVAPQHGELVQVSVSGGGVPKLPVPRARVSARGLEGDAQADRRHHGRPWQAVCLWSAEVVEALADEGHPIAWGSAGENLTVRGLDWGQVRPGVQLLVGTALLEVTGYAVPCRKNAAWFSDGRFRRMAHEVSPGASRVYARVLVDGVVAPGDGVLLEPVAALVPRQGAEQRTGAVRS